MLQKIEIPEIDPTFEDNRNVIVECPGCSVSLDLDTDCDVPDSDEGLIYQCRECWAYFKIK